MKVYESARLPVTLRLSGVDLFPYDFLDSSEDVSVVPLGLSAAHVVVGYASVRKDSLFSFFFFFGEDLENW